MNKNRPLKPDRPLVGIMFPEYGRPHRIIEHMPRTQDELELAVGEKFIGSLAQFYGRKYSDLRSGAGHGDLCGDLLSHDEQGLLIKIQVVEVINQNIRKLREMRKDYREYIIANHGTIFEALRGCTVKLVDDGNPPYLPNIKTQDGRDCASQLVEWLSDLGKDIKSLECKKIHRRKITLVPHQREVSVKIERLYPFDNNAKFYFKWSGSGPSWRADKPRNLLPTAIENKINKHYSKPEEPFWLLAYSIDTWYYEEGDPDIQKSVTLLNETEHPFDEVWYFNPCVNINLGSIIHIWPLDSVFHTT
jgi:hypothetical protein